MAKNELFTDSYQARVGLLIGGVSSEREVSLKTGAAIYDALIKKGYDIIKIDPKSNDFLEKIGSIDVIFNALHGRYGEDGLIQGFLETLKIPYTGSSVVSSAISMNKVFTKEVLTNYNIPIIPFFELNDLAELKNLSFTTPLVVKPANEGSSVGISLVKDEKLLNDIVKESLEEYKELLIEPYIKGKEVQVAVLNGEVLGAIEIRPKREFYDYEAKYLSHDTQYILPAEISENELEQLFIYSKKINDILKCNGVIRIDYIVTEDDMFLLEVNTLPGMTASSLVPKIANYKGISFEDLCENILFSAKIHGV